MVYLTGKAVDVIKSSIDDEHSMVVLTKINDTEIIINKDGEIAILIDDKVELILDTSA